MTTVRSACTAGACPACGHPIKHLAPKIETGGDPEVGAKILIVVACLVILVLILMSKGYGS